MTLLEFSTFPLDKGGGLSPYAARSLDIIDRIECSVKIGHQKGHKGQPASKIAGVEREKGGRSSGRQVTC